MADTIKRNDYGVPVGIAVDADTALRLNSLRIRAKSGKLSDSDKEKAVAYFAAKYPETDPAAKEAAEKAAAEAKAAAEKEATEKAAAEKAEAEAKAAAAAAEVTVEDMKAALLDQGVTIAPNATDERIAQQYADLLEEA